MPESAAAPPAASLERKHRSFAAFTWVVLGYNLVVILWGAYVRAAGAGNGCGANWPLCDGQFLPHAPTLKMLIEFLHRASSGIDAVLVLVLLAAALRLYPKRHRVRRGAGMVGAFLIIEALLGAALVLFGWVGLNASPGRVIADALHLTNTLLLLASLLLTAAWASGLPDFSWRRRGRQGWLLGVGLAAILMTGMCGVEAALADTLYPSTNLLAGLQHDFSAASPMLERLRALHPAIAILTGIFLLYVVVDGLPAPRTKLARKLGSAVAAAVLLQWSMGAADLLTLAPTGMQIAHLFCADLLWMTVVLYAAARLGEQVPGGARAATG